MKFVQDVLPRSYNFDKQPEPVKLIVSEPQFKLLRVISSTHRPIVNGQTKCNPKYAGFIEILCDHKCLHFCSIFLSPHRGRMRFSGRASGDRALSGLLSQTKRSPSVMLGLSSCLLLVWKDNWECPDLILRSSRLHMWNRVISSFHWTKTSEQHGLCQGCPFSFSGNSDEQLEPVKRWKDDLQWLKKPPTYSSKLQTCPGVLPYGTHQLLQYTFLLLSS